MGMRLVKHVEILRVERKLLELCESPIFEMHHLLPLHAVTFQTPLLKTRKWKIDLLIPMSCETTDSDCNWKGM